MGFNSAFKELNVAAAISAVVATEKNEPGTDSTF